MFADGDDGRPAPPSFVFNEVTTGAANDIEKVTSTAAKQMIMRFGMSGSARASSAVADMPFLGREMSAEPSYSEEMAREIDDEIGVIEEAHRRRAPCCATTSRAAPAVRRS